jgi:hypothetical protein
MPTAAWQRINPVQLQYPGKGKFAIMVMAVAAKKHVTIFSRSRRAPGAGHPITKAAFIEAAHKTVGVGSRMERNEVIRTACHGKGPGVRSIKGHGKTTKGKIIRTIPTR